MDRFGMNNFYVPSQKSAHPVAVFIAVAFLLIFCGMLFQFPATSPCGPGEKEIRGYTSTESLVLCVPK